MIIFAPSSFCLGYTLYVVHVFIVSVIFLWQVT